MATNSDKKAAMIALLTLAGVDREVRIATETYLVSRNNVGDEALATIADSVDMTALWNVVIREGYEVERAGATKRFQKAMRAHARRAATLRVSRLALPATELAEDASQDGDAPPAPVEALVAHQDDDVAPAPDEGPAAHQDDDAAPAPERPVAHQDDDAYGHDDDVDTHDLDEHEDGDGSGSESTSSSSSPSSSTAPPAPFPALARGLTEREVAQRRQDSDRRVALLLKAHELGFDRSRGLTPELEDRLRSAATTALRKAVLSTGQSITEAAAFAKTYHGAAFMDLATERGPLSSSDAIPDEIKSILIDPASASDPGFAATLQHHAAMAGHVDSTTRFVDELVISYDVANDADLQRTFPSAKLREWQAQLNERRQPLLICLTAVRTIAAELSIREQHHASGAAGAVVNGTSGLYMHALCTQVAHLQARYACKITKIQDEIREASGLREGVEEALGIARSSGSKCRARGKIISAHERRVLVQLAKDQAIVNASRPRTKAKDQHSPPKKSGKKQRQRRPERSATTPTTKAPQAQPHASPPPATEPPAPVPYRARSRSPAPPRHDHYKKDHFRGRGPARQ